MSIFNDLDEAIKNCKKQINTENEFKSIGYYLEVPKGRANKLVKKFPGSICYNNRMFDKQIIFVPYNKSVCIIQKGQYTSFANLSLNELIAIIFEIKYLKWI